MRQAPLADVVHHADHLLPGTVVAALREHLAQRASVRPEGPRHRLVDHYRIDHGVGLALRQAAALGYFLVLRIDPPRALDVGGPKVPSLQPPHPHGMKVFAAHRVGFHQPKWRWWRSGGIRKPARARSWAWAGR